MKLSLIICITTIYLTQSKEIPPSIVSSWNKLVQPFVETCIEEESVDAEIARNVFSKNFIPKEEHIRCYFKCIDSKLGFLLPGGKFNKELMINKIEHFTPKIADKCLQMLPDDDDCLKSHKLAICIVEQSLVN
ncbi:hypothetical protein FQR65_LT12140 [Abscondita terminalis]|nr:hypothetical protein FQR65_LT12140 [Abscondita terminalis]